MTDCNSFEKIENPIKKFRAKHAAAWLLLLSLVCCSMRTTGYHDLSGKRRQAKNVDAEIARLMNAAKVPGLALAIIENGKVAYEKAYGAADL